MSNQTILEDEIIVKLAYSPYEYFYNSKGYLVIKQPEVIKAKLRIFDFYFWPHPYSNRFNDIMMDNELRIDEFKNDNHVLTQKFENAKKRNGRFFLLGSGTGTIITFFIIISIMLISK